MEKNSAAATPAPLTRGCAPLLLRGIALFAGLSAEAMTHLAAVTRLRTCGRGEVIVRAGELTDALYVLASGGAKVLTRDDEGREVILSLLSAGDFFGEMGLISGTSRSADVVADQPSTLVVLHQAEFRLMLAQHPELSWAIMAGMVERLRLANRKIESLALMDVYGRVARLLNDLAEACEGRRVVRRRISRVDMARMVGSSREMISRVMKDLETDGYVRISDDGIEILA